MRPLLVLMVALFCAACSTLRAKPNRLVIEKRWTRGTLDREYLGGRRVHRFAPILTENTIYTANSIDGLTALDRRTARPRWRLSIRDGVEAGAQLIDDTLYFGAGDGQLYAVAAGDGHVRWTYPLKAEGLARPRVVGGIVYVLGGNNVAHALNAQTGKLLWVYNRREAGTLSIRGGAQPAISGDLALFGFSDGVMVALNKSSGALMWETTLNRSKRFRDVDASPVIDGDVAYASSYDGALYALNVADGKVIWSIDEGGDEEVLVQGANLYYATSTGKVMAIDKVSGKTLWSRANPHGISTAPVAYKNTLLTGEMDGNLRVLDQRTGDLLGEFPPGRGVTSRATADPRRNEVYFMSADANLYALRIGWRRFARDWPWE